MRALSKYCMLRCSHHRVSFHLNIWELNPPFLLLSEYTKSKCSTLWGGTPQKGHVFQELFEIFILYLCDETWKTMCLSPHPARGSPLQNFFLSKCNSIQKRCWNTIFFVIFLINIYQNIFLLYLCDKTWKTMCLLPHPARGSPLQN